MKTEIFCKWSCALALAALPWVSGCGQNSAIAAQATPAATPPEAMASAAGIGNSTLPEDADQTLANAPGQIISVAKPPAHLKLSATAAEIVKLAQAGVDESVMLAFVTNSTFRFNLSSDDIIYLNDVGVPGSVVTAMIQQDEALKSSPTALVSAPQAYTNQPLPDAGAPTPYPLSTYASETTESQPATEMVEYSQAPEVVNVSYSYFYDSLAPYGSWISVGGYGPCWRPTAAVTNPGWQPYCDRGRWAYSDCGWYWASDYSWGWAPFHYGRWFNHSRWGWCWAPDTVWGPSWVSWRYSPNYCGWAPLPPTACFTPGVGLTYYGRSVGVSFGFGLAANRYTFVPVNDFNNRYPSRHRLAPHQVRQVFNNSVVLNEIAPDRRHGVINRGIPVNHVASATRTVIRPLPVRDAESPVSARMDSRDGSRALAVYRPSLPQPQGRATLVGEGVKPAARHETLQPARMPNVKPGEVSVAPREPRTQIAPASRNQPTASTRSEVRPNISPRDTTVAPATRPAEPLILRGSDRPVSSSNGREAARPRIWPAPGANRGNPPVALNQPASTAAPSTPAALPARQNNSSPIIVNSPQRRSAPPATQPQYSPQAPNSSPQPNQRINRPEAPRYQAQEQRVYTQPSAPVQRQPAMPASQAPRPANPQQQFRPNPAPERTAPAVRQETAAPRVETSPAPAPAAPPASRPAAPAPSSSRQSGASGNRQQNR